jgi:hypothetical protein
MPRVVAECCVGEHIYLLDGVLAVRVEQHDGLHASPDYMWAQTDIDEKMRAVIIDWLVDVHLEYMLLPETMYLTVNIIDRFLSVKQVARKKLQLVGATAMLIASKHEENSSEARKDFVREGLRAKDFVYITDYSYYQVEILKTESLMLNTLGSNNLTVPSALQFLTRFIKAADLKEDVKFEMLYSYTTELMSTS